MIICVFQHKQEEADEVKRKLSEESRSDHIALLRAFEVHTLCDVVLLARPSRKGERVWLARLHSLHEGLASETTLLA